MKKLIISFIFIMPMIFVCEIRGTQLNLSSTQLIFNSDESSYEKYQIDSEKKILILFSYIPDQYFKTRGTEIFPVKLYYYNFYRIRNDMKISNISESKRTYYLKQLDNRLSSSNFRGLLIYDTNPIDQNYLKEWGWDILNIDQAIYLPDRHASIFYGNFNMQMIKNRLLRKGYIEQDIGEFSVYISKNNSMIFGLKQNIMLICVDQSFISQIINQEISLQNRIDNDDSIIKLSKYIANDWGAYIAPKIDLKSPLQKFEQKVERLVIIGYYQNEKIYTAWDLMALSYNELCRRWDVVGYVGLIFNRKKESDLLLTLS